MKFLSYICAFLLIFHTASAQTKVAPSPQGKKPEKKPQPREDSFEIFDEDEAVAIPPIDESSIDKRYKALETLTRGLFFVENLYVDPDKTKLDQLTQNALKGIVDQLDPHTVILPKKAFQQLTDDTQGRYGGIGIILSQDKGKLIVISPIEDSPATKAGIQPGDEIVGIDGTPLSKMKPAEAMDRMQGEPGSKVKLEIKRKDIEKTLQITIVRDIIKVKSVRWSALGNGIYQIKVASFQETTGDDLQDIIKNKIQEQNIKALVLDLRDNPGGLLDQAVRVSDLFIESGVIVSTVGRDPNRVEREYAHKRGTFSGFPMITLINGGSASASEIVAGALQDHERAIVMGTTSFGKGSVQTLVPLPDGSGLKVTIARYFTPKDRSIQARGIIPDITVRTSENEPVERRTNNERRESDLKGHIESKDLSDLAKKPGISEDIQKWSEAERKDYQLITAYSYLKSWSIFQKK